LLLANGVQRTGGLFEGPAIAGGVAVSFECGGQLAAFGWGQAPAAGESCGADCWLTGKRVHCESAREEGDGWNDAAPVPRMERQRLHATTHNHMRRVNNSEIAQIQNHQLHRAR